MNFQKKNSNIIKGFTLIELLVVIGIIIILAAIVVIAINPGEKLAHARDNQRTSHVNAIYGAIEEYLFYSEVGLGCLTANPLDAVLCVELVPVYMISIPKDPVCGNGDTGYDVKINTTTQRIGVMAPCKEGGVDIIAGDW